ncbi:hypothetical protein B566_EDAN014967 [Ephemera danica]|nr:hypothetical protein B566_EDAN014967 [Ephemera danica]
MSESCPSPAGTAASAPWPRERLPINNFFSERLAAAVCEAAGGVASGEEDVHQDDDDGVVPQERDSLSPARKEQTEEEEEEEQGSPVALKAFNGLSMLNICDSTWQHQATMQ